MSERENKAIAILSPSKIGVPNHPTNDLAEIGDALIRATASGYNLVGAGASLITRVPAGHAIEFHLYFMGSDVWYSPGGGVHALTKNGLNRLAQAAGLHFITDKCGWDEMPPDSESVRYRAVGEFTDIHGVVRTEVATKTASKASVTKDKFGYEKVETKAKNRVIRSLLSIGGYTQAQTRNVFVVPALVPNPDMTNPMIAAMVTAKSLGLGAELFEGMAKAGVFGGVQYEPNHSAPNGREQFGQIEDDREIPEYTDEEIPFGSDQ